MRATFPALLILFYLIIRTILGEKYKSWRQNANTNYV
jgi:hypothetical protein